MSMRVNCLTCGFAVALDQAYNNYEGQVRCFVCGSILHIRSEEGMLRSVEFIRRRNPSLTEAAVQDRG